MNGYQMKHEQFIEDLEALCKQYWKRSAVGSTQKRNPSKGYDHSITIAFSDKELKTTES